MRTIFLIFSFLFISILVVNFRAHAMDNGEISDFDITNSYPRPIKVIITRKDKSMKKRWAETTFFVNKGETRSISTRSFTQKDNMFSKCDLKTNQMSISIQWSTVDELPGDDCFGMKYGLSEHWDLENGTHFTIYKSNNKIEEYNNVYWAAISQK